MQLFKVGSGFIPSLRGEGLAGIPFDHVPVSVLAFSSNDLLIILLADDGRSDMERAALDLSARESGEKIADFPRKFVVVWVDLVRFVLVHFFLLRTYSDFIIIPENVNCVKLVNPHLGVGQMAENKSPRSSGHK